MSRTIVDDGEAFTSGMNRFPPFLHLNCCLKKDDLMLCKKLINREINGRKIKTKDLSLRAFSISNILDRHREILRCIVLGFSNDGNYLSMDVILVIFSLICVISVSYSFEFHENAIQAPFGIGWCTYKLQVWQVLSPVLPIVKVKEIPLFQATMSENEDPERSSPPIDVWSELGLQVTTLETANSEFLVVHGCNPSNLGLDDTSWEYHYVTIIASPFGPATDDSAVHIVYSLPSVDGASNIFNIWLAAPDILILNNVNYIVIIKLKSATSRHAAWSNHVQLPTDMRIYPVTNMVSFLIMHSLTQLSSIQWKCGQLKSIYLI